MASAKCIIASALMLAWAVTAAAQPAACDRLFKIENGLIQRIEATLERVPYGMTSGWSSWEDGMSDRARDVTR
jgi:hypothetical protein